MRNARWGLTRSGRITALAVTVTAVAAVLGAAPASARPASPTAAAVRSLPGTRAQAWGEAEEQGFVDRINQLRSSLGLATLAVDPQLTEQARQWASTMKDAGSIFHSPDLARGITADWQKLGENVGVGGTVDALHDAFVASPKHYENLVDPSYRFIGVGVVWDGDRMFTTHRFMALMPPSTTTTNQPAAGSQPSGATVDSTPTTVGTPVPDELASTEPSSAFPVAASPERVVTVYRSLSTLLN